MTGVQTCALPIYPRFGVEREYALALGRPLAPDQVAAVERGVRLDEGLATLHHLRPMTAVEIGKLASLLAPTPTAGLAWYRATLRQGWKRQLRRMFGAVDAPIDRLVRVRIGPVRIDGLRSGRMSCHHAHCVIGRRFRPTTAARQRRRALVWRR